jgi:AcrR family transcriptional regulator
MDNQNSAADPQITDDSEHESILDTLITEEMGDSIATVMRVARRTQEAWFRGEHPDEGLRERKRRLTRQLISDAATTMFATRGFDNVRVSEVADRVGVSEKTIYNYFPTKESMVLDGADEMVDRLALALRNRPPGQSITDAVVRALEADAARFDRAPDELIGFLPLFQGMIESTPALHAAWLGLNDRLARVATEELAAQAGVDPRDPEPIAAGRALMGLIDVGMQSRVRHAQDGLRGDALRHAVADDVWRATRLLETGLWSFNLPAGTRAKTQAAEAARAAEEARRQVVNALREARAAWEDVRRQGRQAGQEAVAAAREAHRQAHATAREAHRRHRS